MKKKVKSSVRKTISKIRGKRVSVTRSVLRQEKRTGKNLHKKLSKSFSITRIKSESVSYQSYRRGVKKEYGEDIVGNKHKRIDRKKKIILDKVRSGNTRFNATTVLYLGEDGRVKGITLGFSKRYGKKKRFKDLYELINEEKLKKAINRYAKGKEGYPRVFEILSIMPYNVTKRTKKISYEKAKGGTTRGKKRRLII